MFGGKKGKDTRKRGNKSGDDDVMKMVSKFVVCFWILLWIYHDLFSLGLGRDKVLDGP